MASFNKVLLMGNLTRKPELRYTPSGMAVCEFTLAVNRRYSQGNETKEDVCFVDITVWDRQADNCSKYLDKGSSCLHYNPRLFKENAIAFSFNGVSTRVEILAPPCH